MIKRFAETWNKYRHEVRAAIVASGWIDCHEIARLVLRNLRKHADVSGLPWQESDVTVDYHGDTVTFLLDTDDEDDDSPGYVVRFDRRSALLQEVKALEELAVSDFGKHELDVCMEFARRVVCGLQEIQTIREPGYVLRREEPAYGFSYVYLDLSQDCWTLTPDDAMVFTTYAAAAENRGVSRYARVVDTEGSEELLR